MHKDREQYIKDNPEPIKAFCDSCLDKCLVVPVDNSFDYAGTHCTHGMSGTHRQIDYLSDCCESDYSDGNWAMCKCGNEIELHPNIDLKTEECPECHRVGCWEDELEMMPSWA